MQGDSVQWEFCTLELLSRTAIRRNRRGYNCNLVFCRADGGRTHYTMAKEQDRIRVNPFLRTMAALGVAGWELVSVQHGCTDSQGLNWDVGVAYFKRPVLAGRAIDEPTLQFENPES